MLNIEDIRAIIKAIEIYRGIGNYRTSDILLCWLCKALANSAVIEKL